MMARTRTALVSLVLTGCALSAGAQGADSTPRFSIFGGPLLQGGGGWRSPRNMEYGGSVDFRPSAFPLALRTAIAFRDEDFVGRLSPARFATASLSAIARPIPRIFAIQPYLLGGLGLATRSDFVAQNYAFTPDGQWFAQNSTRSIARTSWAFAQAGLGLEVGRHIYVERRFLTPVGSSGPFLSPVSVGVRF